MTPECGKMVHEQTVCVYLKASVDELVARLSDETAGRPLLSGTDSGRSCQTALRKRILDIFTASHPATIVGVHELNFCVRNGNRWTLMTINTNSLTEGVNLPI